MLLCCCYYLLHVFKKPLCSVFVFAVGQPKHVFEGAIDIDIVFFVVAIHSSNRAGSTSVSACQNGAQGSIPNSSRLVSQCAYVSCSSTHGLLVFWFVGPLLIYCVHIFYFFCTVALQKKQKNCFVSLICFSWANTCMLYPEFVK